MPRSRLESRYRIRRIRKRLRLRNRRDLTTRGLVVPTAACELVDAMFINSRPFFRTILAGRWHPGQGLNHFRGLFAEGWNRLGPTGVE